jgi:hypothetical protein
LSNATSVLQSLDPGTVTNFKALYRKLLFTSVVGTSNNFQSITGFLKSIHVADAVLWVDDTWDKVNQCFTIANFVVCFTSHQQESTTDDLLQLTIDSL